jgi:ABC-type hemin transport system ATPase subunit
MFPEQHIKISYVFLNKKMVEGGFYTMTESIYILRQNPSNDFSKSLDNIIRNGAIDDHLSNKEKDELIDEVIRMTCLSDDLENATQKDLWEKPLKNSVSGGQQTRINLANILYKLFCLKETPYLLLLDELDAGIYEGVKLNDFDRKEKNKENMIRNILKNIYNHPKLKKL